MRRPLDHDDVEGLMVTARRPAQHVSAAERLQEWAREVHPDDEATPAEMLVAAVWHLQQAGDHEQAVQVATAAVGAPGEAPPDVRCWLHDALVHAGRLDEAHALAGEIRRSRPTDPGVYLVIGEAYEGLGKLEEANRWFTTGRVRLGLTSTSDARPSEMMMLMGARRRVRAAQGFPPDEDDLAAAEHQARMADVLDGLIEG